MTEPIFFPGFPAAAYDFFPYPPPVNFMLFFMLELRKFSVFLDRSSLRSLKLSLNLTEFDLMLWSESLFVILRDYSSSMRASD